MRVFPVAWLAILFVTGLTSGRQEKVKPAPSEPKTREAIQQFNEEQIAAVQKMIAGREDQPSEAVYKNIRYLNKIPAGNLLKIMEIGYSRSLGVSCAHCHIPGEWDKDDKPAKLITRDMWKMSKTINQDLLSNIAGINDRKPVVNCTTCHRGQLKPALNLDTAADSK
jgi:Photosynthetic reaction centre cytochrome C subunit